MSLLRQGGVDLAGVRVVDGPTGVALILVEEAGENSIAVIPGANGRAGAADAEAVAFATGDILLLQLEVPIPAIEAAAKRARSAGAAVLLNFAPFRADALGLLPLVTHLIVNESECALVADALGVAGGSISDQAEALAERYALTVIVTLGREGALAIGDGSVQRVAALAVDAMDTVGAGDTFCGYLAAGLVEGMAVNDALVLASAAASLACMKPGAQPAIPSRREVNGRIGS